MARRSVRAERMVEAWQAQAARDRESADALLLDACYGWCAFACHQYLEKLLKAAYVRRFQDTPPKVHNLLHLARSLRSAPLPKPIRDGLSRFNRYYEGAIRPDGVQEQALRRKPSAFKMRREAARLGEWIQDEFDV